jgi:hypothetical protein
MSTQFSHLFDLEEANRQLKDIRPLVVEMLAMRQRVVEIRPDLEGTLQKAVNNGGSHATGDLLKAFEGLKAAIESIQARGILVKDINRGLLDFPALRQGRVVFLCWLYDEPSISYWHEIDDGFAGREPI